MFPVQQGFFVWESRPNAYQKKDREGRVVSIETDISEPNEVELLQNQLRQEIQGRQQAEAALESKRREVKRLELISRHTLHAVIVANSAGEIEWANEAFTRLTGYPSHEVLGRRPDDILQGPETDPETQKIVRETLGAGQPVDVEIINYNRDREPYWAHLQITPVCDDDGELLHFIATQTDISQSKQQAELLDGSEGIYRDLFETTRDAIMSLDDAGFFNCNNATLKLFGFDTREEFCMSHPLTLSPEFQPDGRKSVDAIAEVVGKAFRDGNNQFEWRHCRRDGTEFDAEISLSRYQIESGPVIQASVRDISERKAAEAELIDAKQAAEQASQAKSEFLANMSHEIRTPLNGILGFTEMLRRNNYPKAKRVQHLKLIQSSGQHLLGLINDILDLSKIEAGKMQFERRPCSIWNIIQEVTSELSLRAINKGLILKLHAKTPLPTNVRSDAVRLKQLLTNLVCNALKFTPTGKVMISVSCVEPSRNTDFGHSSQPSIVLEVHDTGIGIAQESLQNIFAPFNQADNSITRRFGGTGLGLAICRRIAEGLGGQIEVASEVGVGSLFRVTLPIGRLDGVPMIDPSELQIETVSQLTDGQKHARDTVTDSVQTLPAGTQILLCEDGDTNRELVELVLEEAGVAVTTAVNGIRGLEAVKSQPDQFDLILMDMQMPIMDGYTATTQLRELGYDRPIIALTAHAMLGDEQRCLDAGCTGYLTKPIDIPQLLLAIQDALRPGQSSDENAEANVEAATTKKLNSVNTPTEYDSPIYSSLPSELLAFQLIIERFIVDKMPAAIEEIQTAIDREDWQQIGKRAHALVGSGGTVGFACFTEPARKLEKAAKQQDLNAAQCLLLEIRSLADRLVNPRSEVNV